MDAFQVVALYAQIVSLASLLLGLLWRRRVRVCVLFFLYMSAVLASDLMLALRPALFTWGVWLAVELLHGGLRLGLATELGFKLFSALPGARATLAAGLLLLALLTLAAVVGAPLAAAHDVVARTALARVLHGTAWIFGAIQGAKLYYRIPAHPLHNAILRGLVPFLLTFTVALSLLDTWGWDVRSWASYGYTLAYQVLLLYWNRVAWRGNENVQVPPQVMHTLQPWR